MTSKKQPEILLTRREAILRVSALLGGMALVGQGAMLAGCEGQSRRREEPPPLPAEEGLFSNDDIALLDEIAETILPATDTPGAKAAGVGPFMALMVTDCYTTAEQQVFRDGMQAVDRQAIDNYGVEFMAATPEQRLALLETLDAEQFARSERNREEEGEDAAEDTPAHYFRMMKELALLGYFTSEIGYTQAMRYAETPGGYDPCAPYEPGEKAWAAHA